MSAVSSSLSKASAFASAIESIASTDRERAYLETWCDADNKLHTVSSFDMALSLLLKIHFDGLLFRAIKMVEELRESVTKSHPELIDDFDTHPLIVDIITKHQETLQMLDFLHSPKGWSLIKDDGEWKSESIIDEKLNTHSFRVSGVGNVPMFNLTALFHELDLLDQWIPLCAEALDFGSLSLYTKTGYVRIGLPWPIYDRECLLYGYGVDDLDNGRLLIFFDSRATPFDDFSEPKATVEELAAEEARREADAKSSSWFSWGSSSSVKSEKSDASASASASKSKSKRPSKMGSKDVLRVDVHIGGFLMESVDEENTKVTVVYNCDPKVVIPYKLLNWFTGQFVAIFLKQLIAAAKFEKTSPYLKRIEDNQRFYGRIGEKIRRKVTDKMSRGDGVEDDAVDTGEQKED
jgi:hypothetical protein